LTTIGLLVQQHPAEREINLTDCELNRQQVNKLVEVMAHAQCPLFALNLRGATAPTIGHVLAAAANHNRLTKLNLSGFTVIRVTDPISMQCSISAVHVDLIAEMLGPQSQLEELILDGQKLVPTEHFLDQYIRPLGWRSERENFNKLLSAVGASKNMRTLSLVGCGLFHEDLRSIGQNLFVQERCTLTTLTLSNNFNEPSSFHNFPAPDARSVTEFLSLAAGARCLESLDLGQFVPRDDTFNAGLLALLCAVKTLCVVSPCPDGEAGLPLQIRQQLGANRRARTASVCEMALCVQPHHLPSTLVKVLANKMLTIEQETARSN
jgi:hypothetical protein